jgi:hypothetical protein
MNTPRTDVDQLLSAWLADGLETAPPGAVRAALEESAATRQRRELGLIRRVHNVESTATLNRNAWLRIGVLGMAGVLAVLAVVGVTKLLLPDVTPVTPARATLLVTGLPAPAGTHAGAIVQGPDAIVALRTRSRLALFGETRLSQLGGHAAAALFDSKGTADHRAYTVACLTFDDAAAATAAMQSIRSDFRFATGQWAMGNSPFTDEHLPVGRDEGFERSGTYWAFGGTSANASSRVGHMNVWRVDSVVFIVFGVDWVTTGSSAYQSAIEAGVVGLSDYLTNRVR